MGPLWLTQTPLAGLRKQQNQKLHLESNASESNDHVTCQSQCSLEVVMWSNKHVLDRSTHEILAQKSLIDLFQLFKAVLSGEWKNKTDCPTFLVLLESIQPRAPFFTVSHTKVQSHFPGLPHFSYTYKANQGSGMKTRHIWGSLGLTQKSSASHNMIPLSDTIHPLLVSHTAEMFPHHSPSQIPWHIYTENTPLDFEHPPSIFFFFSCSPAPAERGCPFAEISTLIYWPFQHCRGLSISYHHNLF